MSNSTERILILDGHTNQALACVRSLGKAGYEVLVASHQRLPLSGWSRYCTGTFLIEEQSVDAFRRIREWAIEKGVGIVLPLTERSCLLCNADRSEWEDAGIIVGCGPDEMLRTAFDKALTLELAAAAGVRIPPTRVPLLLADGLRAVDEIGLPCVIKPRWSNAWDGKEFLPPKSPTYLNTRNHLAHVFDRYKQGEHWPLVQGFVAGQGKGVFALCDQGRVVAWFAHERLRDTRPTGSSSSLRRSIRLEPRLREPAERLLLTLKWHGPAMVEFKDDGINEPCLMEINGRFWGSLQLAIDAGVDFPRLWVSILKGETVSPVDSYTEGLTLRWIWGDVKRLFFIMRGAPAGYPGTFPSVGQGLKELLGPQPAGTVMEMWRRDDWRPGVGELAGGLRELFAWRRYAKPDQNRFATNGQGSSNGSGSKIASVQTNGHKPATVTVREATARELSNWDALVMQFDNYRVCHKRSWIRSLEASIKGHPLFLVYEKGGEIVGCLPGFLTSIGPLRLFGSPLQGWQTVGMGPVFDQSKTSTAELIGPLVPFLEKSHGVHHVELISSTLESEVLENLHFRHEDLPTYRARLYPGDENRTMRAMKESARRNVKRAIKLGLEVRFEEDESFVDEHYDQLREVFARGGNMVPFGKKRALEFFRHMKSSGNLIAVSVYLPGGGPNIATGMFTVEGKELLLWMWTHRTQYRWYRPTELMTWTVMKKAMEMGCDTFDFMGRGDFKAKFGAELDMSKHRWTWSRYQWLAATRTVASRGYKWQQSARGRMIRRSLFSGLGNAETDDQKMPADFPVLKGAAWMQSAHTTLACVLGDMDLVRPLGLAGIKCAVAVPPGAASRYSRFTTHAIEWAHPWQQADELVENLVQFGKTQSHPPVLFFESDGELLLVSRNRQRLQKYFRFAIADHELVEDLVDKARFQKLAERLALPVPAAQQLAPSAAEVELKLRFPIVVKPLTRRPELWKPVVKSGKALRIETVEDFRRVWPKLRTSDVNMLAQELIPGAETCIESYHVYVDADGRTLGEFTGQKIRTYPLEYGDSTALITTDKPDVATLGRDLVQRLQLRGVAKFDFKRAPDGRLYLLEVNPRFNLWHHLGALAGVNLPAIVYGDMLGHAKPEVKKAKAGLRWCRAWQDVLAARELDVKMRHWLPWAISCEAKRLLAWDDPMPIVGGGLSRVMDRLRNLVAGVRVSAKPKQRGQATLPDPETLNQASCFENRGLQRAIAKAELSNT